MSNSISKLATDETTNDGKVGAGRKGNQAPKVNNYLTTVSTMLAISGAIGTMFVWLAANFYVGDIELRTNPPFDSLITKVYTAKGQEADYAGPHFQLMPGKYHLEIVANGGKAHHRDLEVKFHEKHVLSLDLAEESQAGAGRFKPTKSWWQFWRGKEKQE